MKYKRVENNYIIAAGDSLVGIPITDVEYEDICSAVKSRPSPPDGYDYMLRTDLTWELVELPPEPSPEATAEDFRGSLSEMGVNV